MALSPSVPSKLNRRSFILSFILIILAGVLVYANSLKGQFVWDDEVLVIHNPYIKDWAYVPKIFSSRLGSVIKDSGAFYRPVQTFTYLIDYSIGRLNPTGYHVMNMVWHILASLGLFLLVRKLFDNEKLSLLTALLFVVNPLHTEAVSYISGRADPLVGFFVFLSFFLYLKHGEKGSFLVLAGMAASYILALLSKEIGFILVLLVWFYHYAFKKPVDKKAFGVLVGVLIGYCLWRLFIVGGGSLAEGEPPTLFERLPGVFVAMTNYYRLLFLPLGLHMEYGGLLFPFTHPKAAIGIVLTGIIFFFVLRKRKKDPFLYFAAGWFFITLLPSSNLLFPINAYMAEHWLYFPLVGFLLILGRFLVGLLDSPKTKGLAITLMAGLLIFYSVVTVYQNSLWSNGIEFYKRMLYYAPQSSRLYNNLAKAYHDAGKNDELIALLKSAIQLQEDNALAHNNLGNAYKEIGNYEASIRHYRRAIEIDPKHAGPYFNLSTIYADQFNKKDEAVKLLEKAIELSPYFSKAYNKLGLIYLERGEIDRSIELLQRAMNLSPDDPEVYHNFGYILIQAGKIREAEEMYLKALEADPNYVTAYHDLAIIYFNQGRYKEAIEYNDKAGALGYSDPKISDALKPFR